jgi:hypothetical protein
LEAQMQREEAMMSAKAVFHFACIVP